MVDISNSGVLAPTEISYFGSYACMIKWDKM